MVGLHSSCPIRGWGVAAALYFVRRQSLGTTNGSDARVSLRALRDGPIFRFYFLQKADGVVRVRHARPIDHSDGSVGWSRTARTMNGRAAGERWLGGR
jgi:hypothetical protein